MVEIIRSSSNVKLNDLSNLATMKIQPPCFVVENQKETNEEVNRVGEYPLQNSPLTKVAVINC
ncbi:hypothetical protein CR513_04274, partial [Mucuna pruriens]